MAAGAASATRAGRHLSACDRISAAGIRSPVELEIGARVADNGRTVLARHPHRVIFAAVAIVFAWSSAARAERVAASDYFAAVEDMIAALAPESARAAIAIRDSYRPYIDLLALDDFDHVEEGLATGGLVPLPDPQRFNIRVRLDGASPIGEMDLAHQDHYVSARQETIGCLLDLASRVESGPIEVTSLVRHLGYQQLLREANANATTDVPTHALGLAFDIAMMNTPLPTVLEIRDVLRHMSDAGDILVIAERNQLVFHVVPQPSRLGWYRDVYARAITGQSWDHTVAEDHAFTPTVTAEIGSFQPVPAYAAEWWAADNVPVDLTVAVHGSINPPVDTRADAEPMTEHYFGLVGGLLRMVAFWT
jgi:hypothetical protein